MQWFKDAYVPLGSTDVSQIKELQAQSAAECVPRFMQQTGVFFWHSRDILVFFFVSGLPQPLQEEGHCATTKKEWATMKEKMVLKSGQKKRNRANRRLGCVFKFRK